MSERIILSMGSSRGELKSLLRQANEVLESRDLPARPVYIATMILEEVLTNFVKYGSGEAPTHHMNVSFSFLEREILLEFEDDSDEFNPLSVPPPNMENPLADQNPGGRGLFLVKSMAESMIYERKGNKNLLKVSVSVHD